MHVESFVWTRVFGYDLARPHGQGAFRARLYSQADLPRLVEAGLSGVVLSVATNPFRRVGRRLPTALSNLERLQAVVEAAPAPARVVGDHAAYRQARAEGKLACFVAIQGGNAADGRPDGVDRLPDVVSRVTLVHLTRSALGSPSSPWARDGGLTRAGRSYVEVLNRRRILCDLAHAGRRTFWEALAVHDPTLPPIVSHTGVCGAHQSWRNLDDDQVRAIADRGGVVGIMYHCGFLGGRSAADVVRHLEHVVHVGGEDAAGLGSDWDGLIVTPRDMPTARELPVLVQRMLDRGWSPERVRKVMGANYLRVVAAARPGPRSQPPTPVS
ncbi:MAG: dipeptidase [Actinomycetota bacterium]|nr:dipeptidase [Actinomycetota bacterium]